jgi:hypothetical protein
MSYCYLEHNESRARAPVSHCIVPCRDLERSCHPAGNVDSCITELMRCIKVSLAIFVIKKLAMQKFWVDTVLRVSSFSLHMFCFTAASYHLREIISLYEIFNFVEHDLKLCKFPSKR